MADAYTDFLNLTKPEVGGSRDAWGNKWNDNADTISLWAKATDALAKDALPMTRINKDAQNNVLPWAVAAPVNYAEAVAFAKGLSVAKGKAVAVGSGSLVETLDGSSNPTSTDLIPSAGKARAVHSDGTELFAATKTGMTILGQTAWNAGNLTPADYASKVATALQSFAGPIAVNRVNPYKDLIYPNVMVYRQGVDSTGTLRFQNGDTADDFFRFAPSGALWTKEFGDTVNNRIEARAKFYADDRLATARAEYGQAYQKTGGNITGPVSIVQTTPILDLVRPGTLRLRQIVDPNGSWVIQNGDNGTNFFYVATTGNLWTSQLGDIGARIEARAQAFADDRLNTATARINNKSARLALIGDVGVPIGIREDYNGGVITAISLNPAGSVTQVRYRQLQMSDSNGQWYGCGYYG